MATPIKRIEKDFLLKVLYDEQLPVMYLRNRTEYVLHVEKPTRTEMYLICDRPISGIKANKRMELMFDYHGQVIIFSVLVTLIKDEHIIAEAPEFLYKNLARSFSRVQSPPDLTVQFSFSGDRYSLSFPKIQDYESENVSGLIQNVNPQDLQGLIGQMAQWIKDYADGYKLIIFKDQKPSSTEERIVAETGKSLFLANTQSNLPRTDPYPKKRIITEDMFRRYLESTGVSPQYIDEAIVRFLKSKFDKQIYSDAWIPILFQEYVIGYIHVWISKEGKAPFDYALTDTLYQFAKVLAYSLKMNGYFDSGLIKEERFEGRVIDISVSGLLFVYPNSNLSVALLPDSELAIKLITPKRSISASARIVRRYKDSSMGYFGCRFLDMLPEDMRFLFEFIYGKPLLDQDVNFLAGQV
ncbi:MAG: PilZ domain-containing protein [Spirochaetaceae bacterium]|jgi:hypothetical protein|nr:PilZ domain-containing protein [Spirochaetaceae bacterium]